MNQSSLSRVTRIVGIIGSFLAILVYFLPYVTFTPQLATELSLLDSSIKPEMAVIDIFQNGTGAVVGWTGTILLLANAIMLYFRRQIWLEGLSLLFLIIPLFLIGAAGENLYSVAGHGIAYMINILALIVLTPCFLTDYFVWASNLKKPGKICIVGIVLLVIENVLMFVSSGSGIFGLFVLVPISLYCIFSGLIGLAYRKKRDSANMDVHEDDNSIIYQDPEKYNDSPDNFQNSSVKNRKWMIWGAIAIGIAAILLILWFVWLKPKYDENKAQQAYVYTWSADIYDTPDEENAHILGRLEFGSPVYVVKQDNKTGWARVNYETETGTLQSGYVHVNDIADFNHFRALEKAGFTKPYLQSAIQSSGQRKAVMDYFLWNDSDSIKTVSESADGVCALSALIDGVETIAFIVGKKNEPDEVVIYTVDSNDVPSLYSKDKMPEDAISISQITGSIKDIRLSLTSTNENKSETTIIADNENKDDISSYSDEPESDNNTRTYHGTINNKYAIEMTLTSDGSIHYSGEYFYTKNKAPIQLRGKLTDVAGHLVLEEYVGMNMTGKFEGTISRGGYSGTWTSADGKTSYPFNVSIK